MGVTAVPERLITAVGAAPSYAARAWVNFNGTGTPAIRASGNVSSITDNGVGNYSVNFAVPMENANYATEVSTSLAVSADRSYTATPEQNAAYTRIYHYEQNLGVDAAVINVVVYA